MLLVHLTTLYLISLSINWLVPPIRSNVFSVTVGSLLPALETMTN
ncbi:hypothetical protein GRAN_5247 [Granulicella sibirica]|uniref:Uncharacterized protein n=1 Tax=Granulicella sibirica TaxID=2479048 RepID=A0A4Q0SWU6_9BACT|nr:hypothetical protein GRAN_5247 [Granulicella sibirica]